MVRLRSLVGKATGEAPPPPPPPYLTAELRPGVIKVGPTIAGTFWKSLLQAHFVKRLKPKVLDLYFTMLLLVC